MEKIKINSNSNLQSKNKKWKKTTSKTQETNVHCPKQHPLRALRLSRDNGWVCDGAKGGRRCARGMLKTFQSRGVERFRCDECDFDMCDMCLLREMDSRAEAQGSANGQPRDEVTKGGEGGAGRRCAAHREDLAAAIKILDKIVDSYVRLPAEEYGERPDCWNRAATGVTELVEL